MADDDLLKRKLEREMLARKEAERILEAKSLELFEANKKLQQLNAELEEMVEKRTAALIASERRFRALVESSNDIIYKATPYGNFTYVNPYGAQILEMAATELIGKHFSSVVKSTDRQMVADFYKEQFDNLIEDTYLEFRVETKSKKTLWLGQNVHLVLNDENRIQEITAVARDITERKIAQEELKSSEKKYRGIIENMNLGLLELDNDGVIVQAYDGFSKMTGFSSWELEGKSVGDILLPSKNKGQWTTSQEVKRRARSELYEMQILNKKGELIWVLISAAPIFDKSGTVTGSIGIHMDITEQKKMQDHLLQAKLVAEKARGVEKEFLANMSHEIRTPLNSIIGMAELLSDTPLNDEQKEYLKAISHSSDILHNLITDILDISKIEAGKWVKVEQPFNLNHVLQQHLKSLELRLLEKNVTVQLVLDEKVSPSVVGEKSWLNQILLNILSNAAKFTDKGQISIETKLVRKTADIQHIQLAIHDTGIGMTDEQIKQAFQRFKQGSDAINRKYGGTGLGLAICKKLVELQGGTIEVSSMPGKGSSFNLTIPYKNAATEVREVEQHTINKKTKKDLSQYKALVVEDSPLNQQYIDKILSKWNLPHTIVENGVEALKTLKVETFDVICMDIQMPEMNGYETTKKIRSLNDKNSAVPIIALTATALIDERKKALAAGMNEHLTKPFTPQQLYAVLIKVLEGETPAEVDVKVGEQKNNAIDTSQLHLLYGEDLGFMHEMIRTFLEVTPEHIQKMKELKEKTDWNELGKVAHKCKPTFAMVGMMDAEKIVKEIEVLCKEKGSIAKLDECIALLEAQCNASSGELMNLLNQPSS